MYAVVSVSLNAKCDVNTVILSQHLDQLFIKCNKEASSPSVLKNPGGNAGVTLTYWIPVIPV